MVGDPKCAKCGVEQSHVSHHDTGLYNYHAFLPWQADPCAHTDNPNLCRKLGRPAYDEMVEAAERMEREHEDGETCEMRKARELGIDVCYLHGNCCGEPPFEIDPEQHAG